MATWKPTEIIIDGKPVKSQAPLIVSACRSTDIPTFYADWFFIVYKLDIQHGRIHYRYTI